MIITETKLRKLIRDILINEFTDRDAADSAGLGGGLERDTHGPRNERERLIAKCDQSDFPQKWPRDEDGQRLTNTGGPWDRECHDWVRGGKGKKVDTKNIKAMGTIINFLDPTGITSWPALGDSIDAYRANPSAKNTTLLAINAFSVIPLVGKGGKIVKAKNYFDDAIKGKTKAERAKGVLNHGKGYLGSSNSIRNALVGTRTGDDAINHMIRSSPSLGRHNAEAMLKAATWADKKGVLHKMHVASYYTANSLDAALVHHIENGTLPDTISSAKSSVAKML
jgi:hypothetical protein